MRLYHFALRRVAERIARDGFRDSDPEDVGGARREGVWLADVPLADDGGLDREEFATVVVDAPDDQLAAYEVTGNPMVRPGSHREWCVPAAVVNRWRLAPR